MLTKREALLGGLVTIVTASVSNVCFGQSHSVAGCVLSAADAQSFVGNVSTQLQLPERLIGHSGNNDFDYALAQTLSKLSDVFGVLPGFAYYNVNSYNALATSRRLASNIDGTILFGRDLLFTLLAKLENPDAAVAAVCAHEFGHIVQFKNGLALTRNQPTVKRAELHADFLAGFYAGQRKLERSDFPAAVFAATQEQMGDYAFTDRNHHGRPNERAAAIVRGFEVAYRERRSLADAIQIGVNFVSMS
jgi:hypothetical protein